MMIKRLVLSVLGLLTLSAGAAEVNTSANEQLSDAFVRSAVSFIGYSEVLEGDDAAVLAGTLLDTAIELNPDNAQAWAMRAELAKTTGNQNAYEAALVGYLDTGTDDDRARFDLIQYRLANKSTLDAQLREIEKLLESDAGRALSGPLRSRLASLATSMASELLDEKSRRKWAVTAARADPANLQAAEDMLDLVIELGGDELRQGTAMVNIIRADPLKPAPRLALAGMLAKQNAYERSAQQYQVAATRLSNQPLQLDDYNTWAQSLAMTGQDELLLKLLGEFEAALNQPVPTPVVSPEGAAPVDAPEQEQEKVDLPFHLAVIRLAVLRDSEDKDQAQVQFDRIAQQLNTEQDPEQERLEQDLAQLSLAWVAAVFGPDLNQAEVLAKQNNNDATALGWIALRRGDKAKALELLQPVAKENPLAACGIAIAKGQDRAGRARLLQAFIESDPASSLAQLAAGREMLLLDTPVQPTTTGKALLALVAKYPEAFWRVDLERTPWLDVRLKIKPQRIKPLEPISAEITVWNTTRFPLAITEDGPINQQAVVILSPTSSGRALPPMPPIVVDLGRSYSLKAGERMIIDTRLDYHQFGSLRAANAGTPFAFDARLLVNPNLNPFGKWRPSGIGGRYDVRDSLVEARPANATQIDNWLRDLGSDVKSTKLYAMLRLAALNREAQPDLLDPPTIQKVTEGLLQAWDSATHAEQGWLVVNAIGLEQDRTTYPALLEQALQSKSKLVWIALLSNHAIDKDSEMLLSAISRQDLPEVSRYAERQRRLLRAYATYLEEQQAAQPAQPAE